MVARGTGLQELAAALKPKCFPARLTGGPGNRSRWSILCILNIPENTKTEKTPLLLYPNLLRDAMDPDIFTSLPQLDRVHRTLRLAYLQQVSQAVRRVFSLVLWQRDGLDNTRWSTRDTTWESTPTWVPSSKRRLLSTLLREPFIRKVWSFVCSIQLVSRLRLTLKH